MNQEMNSKARDCFAERIRKSLLGPGAENELWGLKDTTEEIISDYPLVRYYTGILFPEKSRQESEDLPDDIYEKEVVETEIDEDVQLEENLSNDTFNKDKEQSEDSSAQIGQNNFFPSSCALTFCVDEKMAKDIKVCVSFGLYYEPKQIDIKIAINEQYYKDLVDNPAFPLKEELKYENGYMFLSRELRGESHRNKATGDYKRIYDFENSDSCKDSPAKYSLPLFQKLYRRIWKRKQVIKEINLAIEDNSKGIKIYKEQVSYNHEVIATIFTKKYWNKGQTYFKVLLANTSTKQAWNRFTNHTRELNRKSFFQTEIKVQSEHILPYHSSEELNPMDSEANFLNFIYRDVKNYAIGHDCAAIWDVESGNRPKEIKTTFIPKYHVRDIRNSFKESDFDNKEDFEQIKRCLEIRSLSHFKARKKETIERLNQFVGFYEQWVKKQIEETKHIESEYSEIVQGIVENLQTNLKRLYDNIQSLNDDKVFRAFTLANTAMLMQLIISSDKDFAKKEKMLSEYNNLKSPYNDLDFFGTYSTPPRYRPFQLAFLILNIHSITQSDSPERNNIVDLIWFPTGGGKTEAYLAVAAFTILWRRLSNDKGYEGTSVIMRYTLRLLTAQQFERASRLIASLEFLRRNFKDELKSEPITIGLWVGEASTPNTIKNVEKIYEEIGREASKSDKGNPEEKNTLQVSSCPWCGAKLVNRNLNGTWNTDAFDYGKNKFYFKCPNPACAFHQRLPIQVVDEMLYREPPTLLFATVDKFAMLAWQEAGHKFFNSLNDDGLPPDLIIQDELHLLSGALGSITALFESVVEMLCSKNGRKPKMLASTATTRNTDFQIKQLYGKNRKVNIFPPAGLTYDDSFFARESEESKREYIGFMPTGKTSVDCQLRLLSNLLVARMDIYRDIELREACFNNYWSIVSYYNSLKDVGRTNNKIGDEIYTFTQTLQKRLFGANNIYYEFNYRGLKGRVKELTSRENSGKIKQTLKELETPISVDKNITTKDGRKYIENVIDLILATNMISVGIDISRLNIMLVNGQPKNIAEYIQATSRVGRKDSGLVVSLFDANRARDKSYFEHFIPFHQAFYKFVEPLSLTPFTENTIDKMLMSIAVTYVRHKVKERNQNKEVVNFTKSDLDDFIVEIEKRFDKNEYFTERIEQLCKNWTDLATGENPAIIKYDDKDRGLLVKPQHKNTNNQDRVVMQSMREIDTNTFIKIYMPQSNTKRENGQKK